MDLNRATILGRLGQAPEMRYTPNGVACTTFSVATSRPAKKGTEGNGETDWHTVVTWDKLAEVCNQHLGKGSRVYVEGRLQTRSWEGQNGQKNYKTEIAASMVTFLDSKGTATRQGNFESEDDLPF